LPSSANGKPAPFSQREKGNAFVFPLSLWERGDGLCQRVRVAFPRRVGYDYRMNHLKYSKNELLNRVYWVNNFRIVFGFFFFVGLMLLNAFRIVLPVNIVALIMLGIAVLVYGALSFLYLSTQKPALTEIIFISVFLGIIDIVVITVFVYFSGGYESPYFVFYLLALTSVSLGVPFLTFSVFLMAVAASVFYDAMIFLTVFHWIPFYSKTQELSMLGAQDVYLSYASAIFIPIIILFFSFGIYLMVRFMESMRQELEDKVEEEKSIEKIIASLSQVYWILTHVLRLDEMLDKALHKLLEILKINSGMILLIDQKKGLVCRASHDVPAAVCHNFEGKTFKEVSELPANLKGFVWGAEALHNWSIRKLVFHNKPQGLLVFFGKEGEAWIDPRFKEPLDALADELAAAIYYGKLFKKFKADR
jgi:hypothetical protein